MGAISRGVSLFGLTTGALSVALLLSQALQFGWSSPFNTIFTYYGFLKLAFLEPLKPVAEVIANVARELLPWRLELQPHWSDVVVVMTLYFSARTSSYWSVGMRQRALFRLFLGTKIALLTGAFSGLIPLSDILSNIVMFAIPVAGLIIYDLVDAFWSATFYRLAGLSWKQDFLRYFHFSMPSWIVCVAVILVAATVSIYVNTIFTDQVGILLLLVVAVALACYWTLRGWQHASDPINRKPYETQLERFRRSSNTKIGVVMTETFIAALVFCALNAGLTLVGKT